MSCATSRRRRLGRRGTTSLEFALVATTFILLMIASMDLGRYFLTQHSLRTLTAEAERSVIVNCFGQSSCSLTAAQVSTAVAMTPFLNPNLATLAATQTVANNIRTVSITASYPFSFLLPLWTPKDGLLTETATLTY